MTFIEGNRRRWRHTKVLLLFEKLRRTRWQVREHNLRYPNTMLDFLFPLNMRQPIARSGRPPGRSDSKYQTGRCLWDHWSDRYGTVLDSFAAITDEPTPEVSATGHQRTIITIQEAYLSECPNPMALDKQRLEHILSDRSPLLRASERCVSGHRRTLRPHKCA